MSDVENYIRVCFKVTNPVEAAIMICKGANKLANKMQVKPQTIHVWKKKRKFPAGRIEQVAQITNIPQETLYKLCGY